MTQDPSQHSQTQEQLNSQSLVEHLRELRSCLVITFVAVFIGFGAAYSQIKTIGHWFFEPLLAVMPEGSSLICSWTGWTSSIPASRA